ncbi:membrane-spanning 4-domains subfamily A member 18-like isoform X2 [Gouania willdenowi]|uniref:membrane-spanning 4-domains subfamily A member 18-like isoform X2 n=1 Tax=Gouania willdenowi TaxID=441366 RepID=UPI001056DD66|nr:membrane-spanning 4-domains subfamily A member 18-like isoform X2 [Gouania willdenowi]
MSSSVSTTAGNVVVVTHVHPASQQVQGNNNGNCVSYLRFNKVWPMALGTVQIMIGVMILLFGIASLFYGPSLGVYSGIFVWGAALYVSSGSLTIVAGKSGSRCQINGSMALNIIAAVVSLTGVILYALDCFIWNYYGYSGVLAIFQFLELIVSILVAATACNATCSCCAEPQPHFIPAAAPVMNAPAFPSYQTQVAPVTPAQFSAQPAPMMDYSKNPNNGSLAGGPPAYDAPI